MTTIAASGSPSSMRALAVRAPRALAHPTGHPIRLGGLRAAARGPAVPPLVVERRDQAFVEGLLDDLGDTTRHAALRAATPARAGGTMRLFQPLQRVFNLLVIEAFCDLPGQPRLDPKQIESSGFVLRRVAGDRRLAWLKAGTRVFGWDAVDEDLDPAHDRRTSPVSLGHPALDALAPSRQRARTAGNARLAASTAPVGEDIQPLFVAPPDVCASAGRTLLFGTLRVASGELTETPAAAPRFGSDAEERNRLRDDLVAYLREGGARSFPVPPGKRTISSADARAAAQTAVDAPSQPALGRAAYDALDASLGRLLLQLNNEFDAFGDGAGPTALRAALSQLQVETDVAATNGQPARTDRRGAWQFLLDAKAVLFDAEPQASVAIPDRWGAVGASVAQAIFEATLLCLQAQFANVLPASGRFDASGSGVEPRFVVRAFVRLKPEHEGCPGRLIWSADSEPFTIAPWFESASAPVPVIPLPDLFDRAQLKRCKPSVAFALPPKLAQLLRGPAEDLMEGKGDGGSGIGLGWICSFSLPIITLCAFICLNIFLSLFNLIFSWMAFLKICIPIPKAKE